MQSTKFNVGLIFMVFGMIFLVQTTIGAPTTNSDEEFIEEAEEGGALEQEVEKNDDEIYGENALNNFRKKNPSEDDVEDFEIVSKERPHPGDDLIQDGPANTASAQDEEDDEYSVEDFGLRDEEDEDDEEPWRPDHVGPTGSLEEDEFDDDDYYGRGYNYEEDEEDHENWYSPEESHESYWDEDQDGNDEAFGDDDAAAMDEENTTEYLESTEGNGE